MKKISLIVTSLVFCIAAVFVFPAKEAQANPLAVGGALYLGGAGVYVVGAVAVAGIAGLAGCVSCQEDIEAHAQRTWDGSTQIVKDGVQLMVDASVGAWGATSSALTSVDANVNTWVDGQISKIASEAIRSKYAYDPVTANATNFTYYADGTIKNADIKTTVQSTYGFTAYGLTFDEVQILHYDGSFIRVVFNYPDSGTLPNYEINFSKTSKPTEYANFSTQWKAVTNKDALLALASAMGASFGYGLKADFQTDYANVNARTTEAWEEMTDAGLVLPVDQARPMNGDIPLTYDPVTDTYAGIDGITVPHDEVTGFEFPQPNWKTLDDLAALGLSGLGAGLYIDGWPTDATTTSTYDPATDITTTTTSTGTTTNVTTGETAITGTTTTTTTGDTTGNPPVDPPPVTAPKTGEPLNPFKAKPMPIAALTGLFQLLAALIFYLIRMFTFIATLALIAPTPIDNPYFIWFTTATFQGITPYPLVQNLALFFLGFSVYRSVRRVFG